MFLHASVHDQYRKRKLLEKFVDNVRLYSDCRCLGPNKRGKQLKIRHDLYKN